MKKITFAFIVFMFFIIALAGSLMASATGELDVVADHVRGEVVVDLKDSLPGQEMENMGSFYGIHLLLNSPCKEKHHLMVCQVDEEKMPVLISRLSHDKRVRSAEPNYVYEAFGRPFKHQAMGEPNDPLYKYQWHMKKIKVEGAWKQTTGKNVIVAVIDTGVAYEDYKNFHRLEDFETTRFVSPYNFVTRTEHANDDHAHGSHVAGTIAQSTNNKKGVVGVAFDAQIMPLKVLNSAGMGRVSDIADAIRFAADNGARVINMSLGGRMSSATMENACKYAYHKGVTIVCAAGNENSERISYPAAYHECISVSAVRDDDQLTFYSNRGKDIDIAAPGGDMNVDQNGDGYKDGVLQNTIKVRNPEEEDYLLFQGTSMASPHVAGVAALIVSLGYNNPSVVEAILKKSARKEGLGDLKRGYGAGILDADRAVHIAGFVDGFVKLILALGMMLFLLHTMRGIPGTSYAIISPLFLTGLIIGSCGLFFLPSLGLTHIPFKEILLCGFPQWDLTLLGAAFHGNILFYSAFFPFAACFLFFQNSYLRGIAVGFSTGVAAHLAFWLIVRPAEIQFVPGFLFLDRIWLLLNITLCLYLAYIFISQVPGKSGAGPAMAEEEIKR